MRLVLMAAAALGLIAAENPITWTLSGNPPKAGTSGNVRLSGKVEPGWYLYGLTQNDNGPRPTRVWLPEGQPFALKGSIKAPSTVREFDENFGMEVEKFKGDVTFQVPVQASGSGTLKVSVQYQTCNDTLCLPPKTVTLERSAAAPAGH